MHGRQSDRHRQPDPQQLRAGHPYQGERDGHDDDERDLVEHRHADEHRRHHHGDLDAARAEGVEELAGDALGGAGIPHDTADHRAQSDGEHRVADLAADAFREDVRDLLQRNPTNQTDTDRHQQQGGEAVQFELGHEQQQDQHADPDYEERHVSVPL
ncbi:hypothetical protein GCM10010317_058800 [Streptomyces mirabilis]|nr:hypothetical protein GCM10010317_058800 [Streptomyces mirabilis]